MNICLFKKDNKKGAQWAAHILRTPQKAVEGFFLKRKARFALPFNATATGSFIQAPFAA